MGKINVNDIELLDIQKEIIEESKKSLDKYGQAAIHLVTSGGKSYIIASLIKYLKKDNKDFKALIISTPSNCSNLRRLYGDDSYLSESITFIHFNSLQRYENYIDSLNINKVDLIVIDEAHRALANKTSLGVKYIIKKYSNAKLIAATATIGRYDRRAVFESLTDRLSAGIDYQDRGLKYAINNDLICDFTYKTCDLQLVKSYYDAIAQLKGYADIYERYSSIFNEASRLLNEYKTDSFSTVAKYLKQDLQQYGYNGHNGDRWFMFFSRIEDIKGNINNVRNLFKDAYDNDELTINILEYHSGNSDEACQEILDKINSAPDKDTVDVVVTCLKGSESLHPVNTVGIVVNRRTGSEIALTQMFGRALMLKNINNDRKLIYDLVDNRDTLDITQTIFNGTDKPDDRRVASIVEQLNKADNTEKIIKQIQSKYGDGSDIQIMDADIEELIDKFHDLKELLESLVDIEVIRGILNTREQESGKKLNNPIYAVSVFEKQYPKMKGLTDKFKRIQRLFIQGYFGEHTMDEQQDDSLFWIVYNKLGLYLYMTENAQKGSPMSLAELTNIANDVKKYEYDYRNRISKTGSRKDGELGLKDKIQELRDANLAGNLSESYQVFCKRNKIDINGIYSNLIAEVFNDVDTSDDRVSIMYKEYKSLVRYINQVKELIDTHKNVSAEQKLRLVAKEHIFTTKYDRLPIGKQASNAINITYKDIINKYRRYINAETYKKVTLVISSINEARQHTADTLKYINERSEFPIIDLIRRNEIDEIDTYELFVLDEMGIAVFNSRRDSNVHNLVNIIPFGVYYNNFINNNDEASYKKLQGYVVRGLPEYFKKMIKSKNYKSSEIVVKQEDLFRTENESVKDAVQKLVIADDDILDTIKKAVIKKEVDNRNLIRYAIPDKIYAANKGLLDFAFKGNWEQIDDMSRNKILNIYLGAMSGYIVETLLNEGLIPNEQVGMANAIISYTI